MVDKRNFKLSTLHKITSFEEACYKSKLWDGWAHSFFLNILCYKSNLFHIHIYRWASRSTLCVLKCRCCKHLLKPDRRAFQFLWAKIPNDFLQFRMWKSSFENLILLFRWWCNPDLSQYCGLLVSLQEQEKDGNSLSESQTAIQTKNYPGCYFQQNEIISKMPCFCRCLLG